MKALLRTAILSGLLIPVLAADAAAPQTQPVKIDYRERYGVLTERNMFLRDRRRPSYTREPTSRPAYESRPVEESLILTGIVMEEGEYRAYFEDMRRSSVLKLRVGESVGHGVITQMQIDAIEYLNGERHMWIDVGRTLTGSVPPPTPSRFFADTSPARIAPISTTQPSTATTAGPTPTPSPLPNPDEAGLSMEEKMKLRRAQQLGGGQ